MAEEFRVEEMVEDGKVEDVVKDGGVGDKVEDEGGVNEAKEFENGVEKSLGEEFGDEEFGVEEMVEDGNVEDVVKDGGVGDKVEDEGGVNEAKEFENGVEKSLGEEFGDEEFRVEEMAEDGKVEDVVNDGGVGDKVEDGDGVNEAKEFEDGVEKSSDEEFGDEECQDYEFCVGDIVWVETKIKTWWPGRIHDPVDASEHGMDGDQEGCLLVGYFGMGHVAWCRRQQLKPFVQFYERVLGQSKARIFLRAVEKALEEFGGRVKLSMSCACVLKRSREAVDDAASKEGVSVPVRNSSEVGEFSVTQFDCVEFLAHLRSLAQFVRGIGRVDFIVTQSQLLAFYSFTGHEQLLMHLLQEGNDAESGAGGTLPKKTEENVLHQENNDETEAFGKVFGVGSAKKLTISSPKVRKRKMKESKMEETSHPKQSNAASAGNGDGGSEEMIEIGLQSRERKRSRYLSYPYVNLGQKGTAVEGMAAAFDGGPPLTLKSTGEKFWRKWYRRFTGASDISGSSDLKDTSSAEILSEFCSAAVNCQYPIENKTFDSVAWFISNFRISVYHDEPLCETYSNCMAGQDEDKDAETCLLENGDQYEGKSEPKKRKKKAVSKIAEDEGAACTSGLVQSPATAVQGMNENPGKRRVPAKSGRSKTKSLSGMSGVNTSSAPDGQMVQDTQAAFQLMPCDKAKQMKKKKAEGASQNSLQTKQTIGIPDSNGHIVLPNAVVKDQLTIGPATSESNVGLEKRLGTETASDHLQSNMAPCLVDANGHNLKPGTLVVDLGIPAPAFSCLDSKLNTSLLSAESKPAPKKRKRKEKVDPSNPVQTGGIPDLNGSAAECLSPPSKPVQKRKRKGEAQATALLLTFAPGVPVPSKDDLISTFCKFGPLKESETQFLKDPGSAQVVFMESADAGEAFQSLEKNNPFGTNLVGYKRFNLPSVSKVLATSLASPRTKKLLSPVPSPAKGPNLDVIRQNLQMMTSMLEKSGDTLSPEMRTKLECEIKGLLQKVSSTDGSSSA